MIQKKTVFISYNRRDFPFVKDLFMFLENNGYEVWLDLQDIEVGTTWWAETQKAILESDVFLVILSKYTSMSEYVGKEVKIALLGHKRVIPVLVQESLGFPNGIEHLKWVDARHNFKDAMRQLLDLLQMSSEPPKLAVTRRGNDHTKTQKIVPLSRIPREVGKPRNVMPPTMKTAIILVCLSAGVKITLAMLFWMDVGSDYPSALRQALQTGSSVTIVAPEADKAAGLAFLSLLYAGGLFWVARKLYQREVAFSGAFLVIACCFGFYLFLVTAFDGKWFVDRFVDIDVISIGILAAGPAAEICAMTMLLTRSARRWMPLTN